MDRTPMHPRSTTQRDQAGLIGTAGLPGWEGPGALAEPGPPTTLVRQTGRAPQRRVMSPSLSQAFQTQVCSTCQGVLEGPAVRCASCGTTVHAYCAQSSMHEFFCRDCLQELEAVRQGRLHRDQALRSARGLGALTARSSELLGTAVGAVGGATLAAGQFLASGPPGGARIAKGD